MIGKIYESETSKLIQFSSEDWYLPYPAKYLHPRNTLDIYDCIQALYEWAHPITFFSTLRWPFYADQTKEGQIEQIKAIYEWYRRSRQRPKGARKSMLAFIEAESNLLPYMLMGLKAWLADTNTTQSLSVILRPRYLAYELFLKVFVFADKKSPFYQAMYESEILKKRGCFQPRLNR